MMSRANSKVFQRTWLVVAVVFGVVWSLSVQRGLARRINNDCQNFIGNRAMYEKVDWICKDCANIFRQDGLLNNCRSNCFYNTEFLWCIDATENTRHKEQLEQWAAILGAGWN
uniref:Mandibular organ-inhibiting hormone n=1 Tax=Cancer borealis TaxID=39395 RepID=A0A6N0D346_CANBE|nr:mandibular organ-inhibiting hormone [Cancer borealis]QKO41654.1 mandibular organ-inhibiting hormone [Cancer borealis]